MGFKLIVFQETEIFNDTKGGLDLLSRLPAGRRDLVCPNTLNKCDFNSILTDCQRLRYCATTPTATCPPLYATRTQLSSAPTTTRRREPFLLRLGKPLLALIRNIIKLWIVKTFGLISSNIMSSNPDTQFRKNLQKEGHILIQFVRKSSNSQKKKNELKSFPEPWWISQYLIKRFGLVPSSWYTSTYNLFPQK
jgi:hypothetical protein